MITKTIYENLGFLQAIHKATNAMSLEKAIAGLPMPPAPEAEAAVSTSTEVTWAPVEGAEVEFATESGTVRPDRDLTDADGWAVARWTLGDQLGEQEVVARFAEGGICGFVQKPYTKAELEAAMKSILTT